MYRILKKLPSIIVTCWVQVCFGANPRVPLSGEKKFFGRQRRLNSEKNVKGLPIRGRGQILREGVQLFAPGRGVVKNSPGRGMKLFLQGGVG